MSENKVKWHKYPEEKPEVEYQEFLVTSERLEEVCIDLWTGKHWDMYMHVIAWAELPEPYREGEK